MEKDSAIQMLTLTDRNGGEKRQYPKQVVWATYKSLQKMSEERPLVFHALYHVYQRNQAARWEIERNAVQLENDLLIQRVTGEGYKLHPIVDWIFNTWSQCRTVDLFFNGIDCNDLMKLAAGETLPPLKPGW